MLKLKQIEMLTQRIAGILITLISIIVLVMCGNGDDATGILITFPIGIYCLVSKKCVVKIFEEETEGEV